MFSFSLPELIFTVIVGMISLVVSGFGIGMGIAFAQRLFGQNK